MSKILTNSVKKVKLLSILMAAVLAVAIVVGVVCGVKGWGVFNKNAMLDDSNTLTVSLNQYAYNSYLEEVEDICEEELKKVGVAYEMKGEMSGDESEIVYVFASDAKLEEAKAALEAKFNALKNDAESNLNGAFITVATNSEKAVEVLAEYYVLRGVIAGVVLAVLVCAYVMLRYGLNMGIVAGVSTLVGTLMTAALFIITRIPVTASATYALAAGALLTAVTTLFTLNKLRANQNAEGAEAQTAEELVVSSLATKEIVALTALAGVALVIMGAVATAGVRWFAVLSLAALLVAAFIGLVYAPALYLPLKAAADKKPVKDAYIGAQKTSTKIKKIFEKKSAKEEVKAEPVVEETPVAEEEFEEASAVEEGTEETAEEVVEEASAEEAPVEEAEETQE